MAAFIVAPLSFSPSSHAQTGTLSLSGPSEVGEGENATYTIRYSGSSLALLTYEVHLELDSADHLDFRPSLSAAKFAQSINSGLIGSTVELSKHFHVSVSIIGLNSGVYESSFTLAIAKDLVSEGDETFTLSLKNVSLSTINIASDQGSVTTTILAPTGSWMISSDHVHDHVQEGQSIRYTVDYTPSVSDKTGQNIVIRLIIDLTTASSEDFNPSLTTHSILDLLREENTITHSLLDILRVGNRAIYARTDIDLSTETLKVTKVVLSIPSQGPARFTFSLPIKDDADAEPDETFTVRLQNLAPDITITSPSVTKTILSNDQTPTGSWAISSDDLTIREGQEVTYTVDYNGTPSEQTKETSITVSVDLTGNISADDFTPSFTSATLATLIRASMTRTSVTAVNVTAASDTSPSATITQTIPAHGTTTFSFSLSPVFDANHEGDETFTVRLSIPESAMTQIVTNQGEVTTTISEPIGTWTIHSNNANDEVREGQKAKYTIQYNDRPEERGNDISITVSIDLGGSSQAQANDFDADRRSGQQNLTSTTLASRIGSQAIPRETEISATVTLAIEAQGKTRFSFSLPITTDLDNTESNETFTVRLSNPLPTTTTIASGQGSVTTTILANNGIPRGHWTLRVPSQDDDPYNVREGTRATYTVVYAGSTAEAGQSISTTVVIELAGSDPAEVQDFNPHLTSNLLKQRIQAGGVVATNIVAGTTPGVISATVTRTLNAAGDAQFSFSLAIARDTYIEGKEFFLVKLSPSGGSTSIVVTAITGSLGTWGISSDGNTIPEGRSATYSVSYNGRRSDIGRTVSITVTVDLGGSAQANDFDLDRATGIQPLTSARFATLIGGIATPGPETSTQKSATVALEINRLEKIATVNFAFGLPVAVDDDTTEGDETFTVRISGINGQRIVSDQAEVTTTIESPIGKWTIHPNNSTIHSDPLNDQVRENQSATYIVGYTTSDRYEGGQKVSITVTVDLNGTASPADFHPNLTSAVLKNRIVAGGVESGAVVAGTTPNIVSATVTLTIGRDGTANFTFSLLIAPDSDNTEGNETFIVRLKNPSPNTRITANSVPMMIAVPSGTWTISSHSATDEEGQNSSYTIDYRADLSSFLGRRSREHGYSVLIMVTVDLNGTVSPADFAPNLTSAVLKNRIVAGGVESGAVVSGTTPNIVSATVTLTIRRDGTANFSFDLPIEDDTASENDESFVVRLAAVSSEVTLGTPSSVTTSITANDQPAAGIWAISADRSSVEEGQDTSYTITYRGTPQEVGTIVSIMVHVDLSRSAAYPNDFVPRLNTAGLVERIEAATVVDDDNTADAIRAGTETRSAIVELTIPDSGTASFTFSLTIKDDDKKEDDETFTVSLSGQTEGTNLPDSPSMQTTIQASDQPMIGTWSISSYSDVVDEGQDATYTISYHGKTSEAGQLIWITVVISDIGLNPDQATVDDFTPARIISETGSNFANKVSSTSVGNSFVAISQSTSVRLITGSDGNASFMVALSVREDGITEDEETFSVSLSEKTARTNLAPLSSVQTTIQANDQPPSGTWEISGSRTVNEGEDATYTVTYRGTAAEKNQQVSIMATLGGLGTDQLTIQDFDIELAEGTQHLTPVNLVTTLENNPVQVQTGGDYLRVTLNIGTEGITGFIITLPIRDDTIAEDEETFSISLSEKTAGTNLAPLSSVQTTIQATDQPPRGTWSLSSSHTTVEEGEDVTYTFSYSGQAAEAGQSITITVHVDLSRSPISPNDFTPRLDNAALKARIIAGTVVDDTNTADVITEGNEQRTTSVTLTIPESGEASFTFSLMINDDELQENSESFEVTFRIPSGETTTLGRPLLTTTAIPANDLVGGNWTAFGASHKNEGSRVGYVAAYEGNSNEQGRQVRVTVTIDLTAGAGVDTEPADFDASTAPGHQDLTSARLKTHIEAQSNTDVDAVTAGTDTATQKSATVTLTIGSDGRAIFTISLPIHDDNLAEPEETFSISLSDPSPGTTITTQVNSTTTIPANDHVEGEWNAFNTFRRDEGGTVGYVAGYEGNSSEQGKQVRVTLTIDLTAGAGADTEPADFDASTAPGHQDLTSARLATLIEAQSNTDVAAVTAGIDTATQKSVTVTLTIRSDGTANFDLTLPIHDDNLAEPEETFSIRLSDPSPGTTITIQLNSTTTIPANDHVEGEWNAFNTFRRDEGGTVGYVAGYEGNSNEQGKQVRVTVTIDLTAGAGADTSPADFDASTDSGHQPLTSARLATLIEAQSNTDVAAVTAGIDTATQKSVTVTLTIRSDGTANFDLTLPIHDDNLAEPEETFSISLSDPSPGTTITTQVNSTTTIPANDGFVGISASRLAQTPSGTWMFSSYNLTVDEGQDAQYFVQYSAGAESFSLSNTNVLSSSEQGKIVSITVSVDLSGDNPAAPADFDAQVLDTAEAFVAQIPIQGHVTNVTAGLSATRAHVTLTIPESGMADFTLTLPIATDSSTEGAETFNVILSETSLIINDPNPVTTTILTNENFNIASATDTSPSEALPSLVWTLDPEAQPLATAQLVALAQLVQTNSDQEKTVQVQEGEDFSYTISYSGTVSQQHPLSILVSLTFQTAQQDDLEHSLVTMMQDAAEQAGHEVSITPEDPNQVRVTFSGGQSSSLPVTLTIKEDGFEGTETFQLHLSQSQPEGARFVTRAITVQIADTDTPTAEVSKLVTPLVLRAALPSLSDAVTTHVSNIFTNPTLPAPQADEQRNFQLEVPVLFDYQNDTLYQNSNNPQNQQNTQQRWSMWLDGRYTAVDAGHNADVTGNVFNLWSGIDYRVTRNLLIGVLFGYENVAMDVETNEDFEGEMNGNNIGGGGYMGVRLGNNIIADVSLVAMGVSYESSARHEEATRTADFSGGRLMVTSNLTGNWYTDAWRITPRLGFMWTREWQNSYTDDGGQQVDQEDFAFGRLSFGPEIAYRLRVTESMWTEPFVSIEGQSDFHTDIPAATLPGSEPEDAAYALDPDDNTFNARVRFGVNGLWSRLSYRFEGLYDGIGQESFTAWSGTAHLSYELTEQFQVAVQNRYQGADDATITVNTTMSYRWTESLRLSLENEYQPTSETSTVPLSVLGRVDWLF